MKAAIDRRTFLKTTGLLAAGAGVTGLRGLGQAVPETPSLTAAADRLGWRLGVHAYSFRNFTLYESIEKTAAFGLRWFGAYPTQRLSPDAPGVQVLATLPAATRREIRRRLDDAGLKLVHFGVSGFDQGADRFREVFDFAAELGVEALLAEPPEDAFDALEKLCDEYRIGLAIHNHAQHHRNSRYWNPDLVMKTCAGRGRHIGACVDIGQWTRSDLVPLECLRKMEGRILASHFKDMNQIGEKGHCVRFGAGVCDVPGMLAEIHRQNAKPVFMIEYEYNWADNGPDITACARFFNEAVTRLDPIPAHHSE